MGDRLALHDILLGIAGHAYFQPPEDFKLEFPCIKYSRDKIESRSANNKKYMNAVRYQIIVLDEDPDSPIVKAVNELPMCVHLRSYPAQGLNHDVFELYY